MSKKLRLSTESGGALVWLGTDALVGKRAAGKSDQGLFNLLLLTRRVASVAGTEEEAYLGVYYSDKGYGPNEKRKLNAAVELEWFGQKKNEPKLTGQDLIGCRDCCGHSPPTPTASGGCPVAVPVSKLCPSGPANSSGTVSIKLAGTGFCTDPPRP